MYTVHQPTAVAVADAPPVREISLFIDGREFPIEGEPALIGGVLLRPALLRERDKLQREIRDVKYLEREARDAGTSIEEERAFLTGCLDTLDLFIAQVR